MQLRGVRANTQTYQQLLDFALNSGSFLECRKLHGYILKAGFDKDSVLFDKLIDAYFELGDLDGVIKLIEDMPDRSVIPWDKILSGFVAEKMSDRVLGLFSCMVRANAAPTKVAFASALRSCGSGDVLFPYVEQIHAKTIRHGFHSCPSICNRLIDLYAKNGFICSARRVFDSLCMKDSGSWLAMISGLVQNGYEAEAIHLFCKMHALEIFPTPYVLSSVLSGCSKIKLFDIGEQLHALVFKFGSSFETYVCNALLTLYSRMGDFISAERVFSQMACKDGVSYNSLISALAQQGFSDRALELFEKMQLDSFKPDCVTVASLLSACASLEDLYKGEQLHSYAIKAGMTSDIIIEGSLLDLYVKCSDLKTAYDFFLTTQTENVVLWNVMLVAYGKLDNLGDSFSLFRQMQIQDACRVGSGFKGTGGSEHLKREKFNQMMFCHIPWKNVFSNMHRLPAFKLSTSAIEGTGVISYWR
ncbi:hypothetical protein Tsubulata_028666 [Turnera subulata]|uniref:Pentacotripeptide-repeat region of PRORP domain-containing protein n=1 Tax=Turnera subulata TaxID=218843 RepID=A0A9Q0JGI9_9ROSI|nr:hypothetical protein Tsubulata_028666 [Turnera subulata]